MWAGNGGKANTFMGSETMKILGFESSCDETAVSVVEDGRTVLSDAIASQAEMHALYGGVVPEIASRKQIGRAHV